jgi:hypothetical protein
MRADTHPGPERNRSTSVADCIDAALSFALSQLHLAPHGRAIQLALLFRSPQRTWQQLLILKFSVPEGRRSSWPEKSAMNRKLPPFSLPM